MFFSFRPSHFFFNLPDYFSSLNIHFFSQKSFRKSFFFKKNIFWFKMLFIYLFIINSKFEIQTFHKFSFSLASMLKPTWLINQSCAKFTWKLVKVVQNHLFLPSIPYKKQSGFIFVFFRINFFYLQPWDEEILDAASHSGHKTQLLLLFPIAGTNFKS